MWSKPTRSIRSSSRCHWCACSVLEPHRPGTCRALRPLPTPPAQVFGPADVTVLISDEVKNENNIWSVEYTSVSSIYPRHPSKGRTSVSIIFLIILSFQFPRKCFIKRAGILSHIRSCQSDHVSRHQSILCYLKRYETCLPAESWPECTSNVEVRFGKIIWCQTCHNNIKTT